MAPVMSVFLFIALVKRSSDYKRAIRGKAQQGFFHWEEIFQASFITEMKDQPHSGELEKNPPFDISETEQQQKMKY